MMSDSNPIVASRGSPIGRAVACTLLVAAVAFGAWFLLAEPEAAWATAPGELLTGWITFGRSVFTRVRPDPYAAGSAAVYAVAFFIGLHLFLRRLAPPWRLRRTAAISASIVLLFAAGVATVGIAHQAVWSIRPAPSIPAPMPSVATAPIPARPPTRYEVMEHFWAACMHTDENVRAVRIANVRATFGDDWHLETFGGGKVFVVGVMSRDPEVAKREQVLLRVNTRGDLLVGSDSLGTVHRSIGYGLIRSVDEFARVDPYEPAVLESAWKWEPIGAALATLASVRPLPKLDDVLPLQALREIEKTWNVTVDVAWDEFRKVGYELNVKVKCGSAGTTLNGALKVLFDEFRNAQPKVDDQFRHPEINENEPEVSIGNGRIEVSPKRPKTPTISYDISAFVRRTRSTWEREDSEDEFARRLRHCISSAAFEHASWRGEGWRVTILYDTLLVTAAPAVHHDLRQLFAGLRAPPIRATTDPARLAARERNRKANQALDTKLADLKLNDLPRRKAIELLARTTGVGISVDWTLFKPDPDASAAIEQSDPTLRQALTALLTAEEDSFSELKFIIDAGVIHVRRSHAELPPAVPVVTVCYELPPAYATPEQIFELCDGFEKRMDELYRHSHWIRMSEWSGRLLVRAPESVHEQFEKYLSQAAANPSR